MAEHFCKSSFINEREITLEAAGRSQEVLNNLRQSSDTAILHQASLFGQYLNNLEEDYEWSLQFLTKWWKPGINATAGEHIPLRLIMADD